MRLPTNPRLVKRVIQVCVGVFNHDDCDQHSDNASYSDSDSGVNFQSMQVTSATFDPVAHSVILTGTGTDNGLPVSFTIVTIDSSLVSPGLMDVDIFPRLEEKHKPTNEECYRSTVEARARLNFLLTYSVGISFPSL